MEVNLGGELTPQMKAEAAAIDARLREPSSTDLEQEIEKLRTENADLKSAAETRNSELTEEQKRSKRSTDAANAAHARWEKQKQAPASSAPAIEDALPA
jgi:hypothetical protein